MLLEVVIGLCLMGILVLWTSRRLRHYDKQDIYSNLNVNRCIDLDEIERTANTGDLISYADGNYDSIFIRFVLRGNTNHIALLVRRSVGDLYVWHVTTYKRMGVYFEPFAEFRKRLSPSKRTTVYWRHVLGTKTDLNQYFRHLLRPYIQKFEGLPWAGKFGTRGISRVLEFDPQGAIITEEEKSSTPFSFNGVTCSGLVEFALGLLGILHKKVPGCLPDDIIEQVKHDYSPFRLQSSNSPS